MSARAVARDVQQGSPMLTLTMWVTPIVFSALCFAKHRLKCPCRLEVSNMGRVLPAVTILRTVFVTGRLDCGWFTSTLRVMRIVRFGGDPDPWPSRIETHNPEYGSQLGHRFGSHLVSVLGGRRRVDNNR